MRMGSRLQRIILAAVAGGIVLAAGCHSNVIDKEQFKSAINNYLSGRQSCLFQEPVKLPVQADPNKETDSRGYDALVDAGMFTRLPQEKKRFLVGSKQVNDYDLSDKGRSSWTADATEPGAGNFCFGHPTVTSIDSFTPPADSGATQYSVSYHYAVKLPDWANSAEMTNTFPNVAAAGAGQAATATLTKLNDGWQASQVNPAGAMPTGQ